eukprot:3753770-Rhodomonas_salina.1
MAETVQTDVLKNGRGHASDIQGTIRIDRSRNRVHECHINGGDAEDSAKDNETMGRELCEVDA